MKKYIVGIIQMDSRENKDLNLFNACKFIEEAACKGAKLVSLPEVFNVIDNGEEAPEKIPEGKTITLLSEIALALH